MPPASPPSTGRRAVVAIIEMEDEDALLQLRRQLPHAAIFLLTTQPGAQAGSRRQIASALEAWAGPDRSPQLAPVLTPRQQDILELIARGKSNKEIARALSLSPFTVRNHVSLLLRVLNVGTREEAAMMAVDGIARSSWSQGMGASGNRSSPGRL